MKNRYKIFSTGTKVTHARKFLDFKFFPIGEILSQTDKGNKDEKKKRKNLTNHLYLNIKNVLYISRYILPQIRSHESDTFFMK